MQDKERDGKEAGREEGNAFVNFKPAYRIRATRQYLGALAPAPTKSSDFVEVSGICTEAEGGMPPKFWQAPRLALLFIR